ncbi:MAG: prepilin-type N-terminal cleavage/methylation domain-containing protein [Phycisphaerales bacterium]|nr:prepilin-type N-terminal cleavage/methylation domain-containing protein [Phycisphaerales bacterium]
MIQKDYKSKLRFKQSGFTLLELMIVVVIMGIISVSVLPAMSNITTMREGAARDDLVRMIEVAKGRSVASGMPYGLEVNLSTHVVRLVQINSLGETEITYDPLTNGERSVDLPTVYPGVTILSMINGDGDSGSGTIWFDYEATPHTRSESGSFASLNTETATITLSSREQIIVYPYSGAMEVQ